MFAVRPLRSPSARRLCARRLCTTPSVPVAAYNHCVELVTKHDRERYLCLIHAPPPARPGLFALAALNYELARVRDATREYNAARARFGWWRSALGPAASAERAASGDAGRSHEHPVVAAVLHASRQHALTPRFLEQLLVTREADLEVQQPPDLDALRLYAERTAGSLLLLSLECAGVRDETAELAAVQAGCALGIATLLRGTAAHARQGCPYLPAEVTARHRVQLSAFLRGQPSAAVCDAVAEVAQEGVAHLLAAREMAREVPAAARAVLLPATLADHILRQLQRHAYDPFPEAVRQPVAGPSLQLALAWKGLVGGY